MTGHPIDRVVWEALTTRQELLAEGDALAHRYSAKAAAFAALIQDHLYRSRPWTTCSRMTADT
ncbi:MAG: hypothetical protein ACJ8H8_30235 [Geminicoccaceae bacterium]